MVFYIYNKFQLPDYINQPNRDDREISIWRMGQT
jgi:hypothetical protein